MSGTAAGAAKAMATIREKYPDHHKKAGKKGGLVHTDRTKLKGYGTNRELAIEHGKLGGKLSKRKPNAQ